MLRDFKLLVVDNSVAYFYYGRLKSLLLFVCLFWYFVWCLWFVVGCGLCWLFMVMFLIVLLCLICLCLIVFIVNSCFDCFDLSICSVIGGLICLALCYVYAVGWLLYCWFGCCCLCLFGLELVIVFNVGWFDWPVNSVGCYALCLLAYWSCFMFNCCMLC